MGRFALTRAPRKSTPRVRSGRVQRKNHRDVDTHTDWHLQIRVEVPGPGRAHVVSEADLRRFLALIPDKDELLRGLHTLVLADSDRGADGWYESGAIWLNAWPDPLFQLVRQCYAEEHREVFAMLGIGVGRPEWFWRGRTPCLFPSSCPEMEFDLEKIVWSESGPGIGYELDARGCLVATHELHHRHDGIDVYERVFPCAPSPSQARAFSLLHVLLHELGHHRDCMRPPHRGWCVRGETYAEHLALSRGSALFRSYIAAFGS